MKDMMVNTNDDDDDDDDDDDYVSYRLHTFSKPYFYS